MKQTVVIGSKTFTSYKQYQAAYVKEWEKLHQSKPDLLWCKNDWITRLKNPQLF